MRGKIAAESTWWDEVMGKPHTKLGYSDHIPFEGSALSLH